MKGCHVCSGFRKLRTSSGVSLKERLNKTPCLPGAGQQAQRAIYICIYVYGMYTRLQDSASTGRAVLARVRLHKVLGDSQSWVVVLGGWGQGPGARTFSWAGPGLVCRLWLEWAPAHTAGVGGCSWVPTCPGGSHGTGRG